MCMYWNKINAIGSKFTVLYGHCASNIVMPRWYYDNLELEMFGAQWLHLIKNGSVRGLKIIIDDHEEFFSICDNLGNVLVIKDWDDVGEETR